MELMNFSLLKNKISETNNHFRNQAVKSIDKLLTIRNWLIGAYIVEYEQKGEDKAKYGSKLEENLADEINKKGLSARNLKLFKKFYFTYPQIVQTLPALSELPSQTVQTLSASLQKISDNFSEGGMDENLFVREYQTVLPTQQQLESFLQDERRKLNNE